MQRLSLPAIVFSEMNAKHTSGKLFFHGSVYSEEDFDPVELLSWPASAAR
jgi:hypothetical protein